MPKRKKKPKGKILEDMLDFTHQLYRNQRRADIVKKQIQTALDRKTGQMRYIRREGFDFEGTAAPLGKSICIEAKEAKDRLYIDKNNKQGLRLHQLEALLLRASFGACSGVIWMHSPREIFLLNHQFLSWFYNDVYKEDKRKSITVAIAEKNECPQVFSNGMIDYLKALTDANLDGTVFAL